MKRLLSSILLLVVLFRLTAIAYSIPGNIVSNGDFENHPAASFPPWEWTVGYRALINEPRNVASGLNCVFVVGDFAQDLNTVVGQTYQFSFYERCDSQPQTSLLNVFWGNQQVGSSIVNNGHYAWTYHEFTVMADSTTTRIDFHNASATIGASGAAGLDFVSVVAIPEPPIRCLAGLALVVGLGHRLRARERSRPANGGE